MSLNLKTIFIPRWPTLFPGLAALVEFYVQAVNTTGVIPNVQSAWDTFVADKCTRPWMSTAPSYIQNCPISCLVTPKTFVNVMKLHLSKQIVSSKLKQSEYPLLQPRGTWTSWRQGVFTHCLNIPHSVLWNNMMPTNFCKIRPLFSQHFCGDE